MLKFIFLILICFSNIFVNAAELLPVVRQRFFDANGKPLASGKLYSYSAGTTTPKATYTDRTASVSNPNPVILDGNGEANIWINTGYFKFVLKNSTGSTIWTVDQVALPNSAALASAFWRDVVYISSTDSPFTITSAYNGNLISVDTTAGAVIINMPEIATQILPFNVGVKLRSGLNTVTINRSATDTFEGATTKVLSSLNAGVQLIADIDKAPDEWAILDIGTVADGAISRLKLAVGAVAVPNKVTTAVSYAVLTTDDEIYVTGTATITLLAANNAAARPVKIVNAGTGIVTIARSGSDLILGETSQLLGNQYDSAIFSPDGTSKYFIN